MDAQREAWIDEAEDLFAEPQPRIIKMTKNGDEFYFDTTDLPQHINDFVDLRGSGWNIAEKGPELPAYLPARVKAIEQKELESFTWGYKKRQTQS